ncbi:TraB/GumN family protein [Enterococcus faecalis]|uniref:TraB/GumN family protein n=1 Tax=Enterococcus faecalis TaxID=1351 RepID=UPI002AF6AE6A|nr:TraB/GumN family protein [Enterococcus faecalis]WQP96363.1 TraB/GumN family protein [Enterococcus faecalis]
MKKLLNSENFEPIFEQLQQTYPELWESFLIERDLYMSTKILNEEGRKIVVIIGQAHLNGVEKNIKENRKANIEELDGLPPKLWSTRVLESIIPLIIIGLLTLFFCFRNGYRYKSNHSMGYMEWRRSCTLYCLSTC